MSSRLFEAEYLDLAYNRGEGYLYADWYGYVSVGQVKEGLDQLLKAIGRHRCFRVLNDNRRLKGSWTQAVRWIAEEWMPQAVSLGLYKIAFIYAPDGSARYSVDRLLEFNDQYIAQTFDSYEKAHAWLLGDEEAYKRVRQTVHSLTARCSGRHRVIKFDDITHIEADGRHAVVYTEDDRFTIKSTLKEVGEQVPALNFARVHRSYIVNIHYIDALEYYMGGSYRAFLKTENAPVIPVSRTRASPLKRRLGIDALR